MLELTDPHVALETLLFECPDNPIADLAAFRGPVDSFDKWEVAKFALWLEPQSTCTKILDQLGDEGLHTVMLHIANACAHHGIHMPPRIAAVATVNDIPVT
jgi:hypothetical protein|tara:strand:- start:173 stop:475 length:303 start_codon:yes stop_codon:yes gene_type:complete